MAPTPAVRSTRIVPSALRISARLWVVLAVVILAACGAGGDDRVGPQVEDEGSTTTDRVQVADIRFDGVFGITSVTVDGADVGLSATPALSMDTVFGGLELMPGCNTYFGSFTLAEDGDASFTVAGGSSRSCPDLADQEQAVLTALGSVTGWEADGTGFVLSDRGGQHALFLDR